MVHRVRTPRSVIRKAGAVAEPTSAPAPIPRSEANLFRAAFHGAGHAMLVTGVDLAAPGPTISFANRAVTALTGYLPAELIGNSTRMLRSPEADRAELRRRERRLLRDGRYHGPTLLRRKDGTDFPAHLAVTAIPGRNGGIDGWLVILRENTDRCGRPAAAAAPPVDLHALLEGIPHLVWQARDGGEWCASSPQWHAFTGQTEQASAGLGWRELIGSEDRARTDEAWRFATANGGLSVEHRIRRHDGAYRWFHTRALPVPADAPAGPDRLWIGTSTDIHDLRGAEERVRHLAFHDGLTDLGNRSMLLDTLERLTARAGASPFNLLALDIDGFRFLNDQLGRRGGDEVLREVARRLVDWLRSGDFVSRVGGDEFVVVQAPGRPDDAIRLAERIVRRLPEPFTVAENELAVRACIGIASFPADGTDPDELLRRADLAMNHAKAHAEATPGGHPLAVRRFEPAMERVRQERLALQLGLARALERDEIGVAYQVVRDARTGLVHGYEALARWHHPDRGPVPPGDFIPVAEESGHIEPIGQFVLERACRDAVERVGERCTVAVNLSPVQFRSGDLARMIEQALARTGLAPERLELEVTERLLMNSDAVDRTLRDIKSTGVRIALDDFGTGFSNFGYLCRFPFDRLKIDQSFVRRMRDDDGARAVVGGIIAFAHGLSLRVTAEGVETDDQLALLREMGCDQVQGFLLGRPVPITELHVD